MGCFRIYLISANKVAPLAKSPPAFQCGGVMTREDHKMYKIHGLAASLIIFAVLAGNAMADDPDQSSVAIRGSTVRTGSDPVLGCVNYDKYKRLLEFARQKDQDAFAKFAAEHCTFVQQIRRRTSKM